MLGIPLEWMCIVFGHKWRENQPKVLVNSPNRRLECKRPECGIMRWRFSVSSKKEEQEIKSFIQSKPNREGRRMKKQ